MEKKASTEADKTKKAGYFKSLRLKERRNNG
jgi:hypothetical protein